MSFSTVLGSGGAPDSFVGTTGVDAVALANSTGSFFLGANQASDTVIVTNSGAATYTGVLSTATIKGGAGLDVITLGNNANATIYTGLFLNGGADQDTITMVATDTLIASTIQGGKANDGITTGILNSSLVNGNLGVDTITLSGASTASTVYGGGGNDIITDGNVITENTLISGDKGNDSITLGNGGVSIDGTTIKGGEGVDTITLGNAGGTANDDIFVAGNEGNDTLTGTSVAVTEITINGGSGNDTITQVAGTTTTTGGTGNDAIAAGTGSDTILYTAQGQGGTLTSATSGAAVGFADTVTGFTLTADLIGFDASETLVGSSSSALAAAQNNWNMNNTGVFVNTTVFAFSAGSTTYSQVAGAIGTVIGDAGDIAYVAIDDTLETHIFQVTLGTTKETTADLDAGDQIALLGSVTSSDALAAANYTFI